MGLQFCYLNWFNRIKYNKPLYPTLTWGCELMIKDPKCPLIEALEWSGEELINHFYFRSLKN